MRNFNEWLSTMRDSIATYDYYTDFKKVYTNTDSIKIELNILNSLIGSSSIRNDFLTLLKQYPEVLKAIPILIAKRECEIKVTDIESTKIFNFINANYSAEEYADFMENTGLFDLISKHLINNLFDYVMGVEVGMDTNARKNRTGDVMENIIESYLVKSGFIKNKTYWKEMCKSDIEKIFGIDLSKISNNGKTEKRFDFVFIKAEKVFACECNFYNSGGSKLNETARSYKNLALEAKEISNFTFVWFTDGVGWNSAKHNLEDTFDVLDTIYNLNDLETGNCAVLND
ncbi:type II restriction endonuclease [Mycoplasmopsis synoviae]|nr:type II restriction endonuclease [Mycoplasmopsis synoviae]AKB10961.1 restriction endonuclease DpnII [Mycoplasmopsis synoviae ATCC 25204]AKB11206.1 restriction endonuclease DpnII [Mycoplasmopsis synoviae ATCC 25204]UBX97893.1 type II restriction endonuclease [Mycoplasmopsis synoviae]UBX99411.1 type II restriction endonuclease [Mycoplasmopsis synoviae]UBX99755.1 type II restriction endonuclease [Mycoplasmopsis synoviae]